MSPDLSVCSKSHRSHRYLKHTHASVSSMYTDGLERRSIHVRPDYWGNWGSTLQKWSERKWTEEQHNCYETQRQNVCVLSVVKWGGSQATCFNILEQHKKALRWSQGNFFVFICHHISIIGTEVMHGCCEYKETMRLYVTLPSLFLMSVQWEPEENEVQVHLMD